MADAFFRLLSVHSPKIIIRKSIMKIISRSGVLLLLFASSMSVALAAPIGPVYPPPGGVTFSGSGLSGNSGGRTNNYSALDTGAYTDLYWGLWSPTSVQAGLNGSLNTLSFQSFGGSTATFTGTTSWQDADPFGGPPGTGSMTNVNLQFIITLSGASFVSATSVGLNPSLGAVADINGSAFSANLQFLANYGNGWMALNNVQQLASGRTQSSFSGGFYYTEPAGVPDSGVTVGMLGLVIVAMAGLRRRLRTV